MNPQKFQHKYRIPSARAAWHDYNDGDYFITICTAHRLHYFGEIDNDEMHKNVLGQKLDELIVDIKMHNPCAEIPVYQIMPNHVHLIVCIDGGANGEDAVIVETRHATSLRTGDPHELVDLSETVESIINEKMRNIANKCGLLSTAMGGLKSALTKYANLNKIEFGWQTRFHDHIIRNQKEMNEIATYIENNVATWKNDKFYT